MPKKRQPIKYTNPQSAASSPLATSSQSGRNASGNSSDAVSSGRSVNERLAQLRLASTGPANSRAAVSALAVTPTLPPGIRALLQIPETRTPLPARQAASVDPVTGRRRPPGPAPPQSWTSQATRTTNGIPTSLSSLLSPPHGGDGSGDGSAAPSFELPSFPGINCPANGSLMDISLKRLAIARHDRSPGHRDFVPELPAHLRSALISYIGRYNSNGLSLSVLKRLLLRPLAPKSHHQNGSATSCPPLDNRGIYSLDLRGFPGPRLNLPEVAEFLFPPVEDEGPTESWDAPEPSRAPPIVLPHLTHLNLDVLPQRRLQVSWTELIDFVSHLPTLTHLSLKHWPPPLASAPPPLEMLRAQYEWAQPPIEAEYSYDFLEVPVLRRLSKVLYRLEHLDLTGCHSWFPALSYVSPDGLAIDWVWDWGKLSTLVLGPGLVPNTSWCWHVSGPNRIGHTEAIEAARRTESHIRAQRASRGRKCPITVVCV